MSCCVKKIFQKKVFYVKSNKIISITYFLCSNIIYKHFYVDFVDFCVNFSIWLEFYVPSYVEIVLILFLDLKSFYWKFVKLYFYCRGRNNYSNVSSFAGSFSDWSLGYDFNVLKKSSKFYQLVTKKSNKNLSQIFHFLWVSLLFDKIF